MKIRLSIVHITVIHLSIFADWWPDIMWLELQYFRESPPHEIEKQEEKKNQIEAKKSVCDNNIVSQYHNKHMMKQHIFAR